MCLPEYAPIHKWQEDEREFLCVLNRWYARAPSDFASIFNHTFGLALSVSKIRDQFENYLRLHGAQAFLVYKAVFEIPFDDPEDVYGEFRRNIESTAQMLGITLEERHAEDTSPSGSARKAKSLRTRRLYKALVRKAVQDAKGRQAPLPPRQQSSSLIDRLGGMTLSTNADFDLSETLVDVEDYADSDVRPVDPTPPRSKDRSKLAFRVWGQDSKAKFSENRGFTSEAFSPWQKTTLPPPFSPDDTHGEQAIQITSLLHLSMTSGGASTWISVTISLLQALVKASSMKKPRIAVIDLDHPALKVSNKTLHAAEVLRSLKRVGLAHFARYKGHTEYMIWASIPREAIIHHFSLAELISLWDTNSAVRNLLQLHEFQTGRKTIAVSTSLREHGSTLDDHSAYAIGLVCMKFGLNNDIVALHHIQSLVRCLVDGWSIKKSATTNLPSAGRLFAEALGSRHMASDVSSAFNEGFNEGNANLEYFARRRRSTIRRSRST